MNSNFKINTRLALFDYLAMVNEIALEFFNEDGVYQPHIGKINAMRLFYNNCVEKSPYDEKYGHDIVDVKKSSLGNAVEIVGSMINRIAETASSVLTDENIEKVSKIAKEISEGKISAETIVDAYGEHIARKQEDSEHKVVAV